jgi:hypothetical protein
MKLNLSIRALLRIIKTLVIAAIIVVTVYFAILYCRNQRDRREVGQVIGELNGHMGSLTTEPFGAEYHIYFQKRNFTRLELDRLLILKSLASRNPVRVAFNQTNLTEEDISYLRDKLPDVRFYLRNIDHAGQP